MYRRISKEVKSAVSDLQQHMVHHDCEAISDILGSSAEVFGDIEDRDVCVFQFLYSVSVERETCEPERLFTVENSYSALTNARSLYSFVVNGQQNDSESNAISIVGEDEMRCCIS